MNKLLNDLVLKHCIEKNSSLVQNILEHDSLLEDHVEEQLTREEKYYAIKELERDEKQAEYQSSVAKTLAALGQNNNHNMMNPNLNTIETEIVSDELKKERKLVTLPPVNSFNPYQPPPPMCAQARAGISTAQEARGLERLTELLFPKEAPPLPSGKAAELPPLKQITDMPVSKEELADIHFSDEEDFDPRTKKERQKAQLQEQRAYLKLYNDKKKLLNPPKAPKVFKTSSKSRRSQHIDRYQSVPTDANDTQSI